MIPATVNTAGSEWGVGAWMSVSVGGCERGVDDFWEECVWMG